ncbi:MAG TPA: mechanosensitive ion channel family protein [Pyrinomonadaceae bacterium]|nr:mechanosensitive ion channel family protein [Pyrinomonadaceae bacterium]
MIKLHDVTNRRLKNSLIIFSILTGLALLATYLVFGFDDQLRAFLESRMFGVDQPGRLMGASSLVTALKLLLLALLAFLFIRALSFLIFGVVFRLRKGFEAPTLMRNIFSIIAFTILFLLIFSQLYPGVNLAALFTTSAIFGVILGLALQDTLGNFFAGVSLQADRPFQVGDVITVGQKYTGVIEEVSWRSITIRTFQNHVVEINNSTAAKEPIEVAPRNNLNARMVFFNTLYTDSPAKTIHVVREAVREVENVSDKISPVVRIRNLGDNGVDYEVKYWLEDYAKYNDTDALIRQRIWYAFRRAGLNFAYPTRTLYVERKPKETPLKGNEGAIIERLSAVDVFAPLSVEETSILARAAISHVFAPGETVIRAGDPGSSMFVVHNGRVCVQLSENGRARTVATLQDGDFFGEMALFTGEPRAANVVALEETEVLEIGHDAMKKLFDSNPDLAESLGYIIAERRKGLAASVAEPRHETDESEGILSAIKRFFGL